MKLCVNFSNNRKPKRPRNDAHNVKTLKATLWEEATHVLLSIRAPGMTPAGTESKQFVSLLDLCPTLTELCRLDAPGYLDERSLVPLLKNLNAPWKSTAITGLIRKAGPWKPYTSIRDELGQYIRYQYGQVKLYGTTKDPHQWSNLIDEAFASRTIESFRKAVPNSRNMATLMPELLPPNR